jgi:hypothetical protein
MNRIILAALVAACAAPLVAPEVASAAGCTNRSLAGTYGYQTSGWFTPPTPPGAALAPFAETGEIVFAADGTVSGSGSLAFGGLIAAHTFTGTFEISADCTGTATVTDNNNLSANYTLVILNNANGGDVLIQNVSPGYVIQGRAESKRHN